MIDSAETLLMVLMLLVLLSLASNRMFALLKIMSIQGILVSLLPVCSGSIHITATGPFVFAILMMLIKGMVIPGMLYFAVKKLSIQKEVEPIIGYHASIFYGLLLILASVYITRRLHSSIQEGHSLMLIAAITTIGSGLFLMMARTKALTQVIGYLMLENGIYLAGTALTRQNHSHYVVEFGILLDLLVGVMIMGIIIYNINRTFDDVDTGLLGRLKE